MALPLDRMLNVIHHYLISNTEESKRDQVLMQLTAPLADEDISVSADEDAQFFAEMFAQANDGQSARRR